MESRDTPFTSIIVSEVCSQLGAGLPNYSLPGFLTIYSVHAPCDVTVSISAVPNAKLKCTRENKLDLCYMSLNVHRNLL